MPWIFSRRFLLCALAAFALLLRGAPVCAEGPYIVVQSTTSTQNSGLFEHILPLFTAKTGIEVRVVAVGTGQALKNAANGDGDVVLVHSRLDEEKFVADGFGVERRDVMYNDYVIVGPAKDPAGIAGMRDASAALQKIASTHSLFVSRGDDSGTHKTERALWAKAGINVKGASGAWYRETGSGMGATLNIASGMKGHTLADRGTWLSFGNKSDLKILLEGDPALFNQYGVILVNPVKHKRVKAKEGQAFIDWLTGPEGQAAIASYKINGGQIFFPNAAPQG